MSQNSSNDSDRADVSSRQLGVSPKYKETEVKKSRFKNVIEVLGLLAWVFLGFMLAQALIVGVFLLLGTLNVSFEGVNENTFNTAITAVVYLLSVAIVMGLPWLIKKRPTTLRDLGLDRWPSWLDIVWTPAGYVVYMIASMILVAISLVALPFVDMNQVQDTGFSNLFHSYEYVVAFISLVILAPIAEEVLFRGYLLQKLGKRAPTWLAIILTSLLFGAVHMAWNVGIDTFALSIVLCLLRLVTGSLWAPILLHALKNGIAFYLLFLNPSVLNMLGG